MAGVSQKQRRVNERSLANLKPYKPGQSGNPGGKPKGESLTAILRRVLDEPDGTKKRTKAEKFVRDVLKYASRGRAGDAAYAKQVLDRADGAVEGDVTVEIVFVRPAPPGDIDADGANQD